MSAQLTWFKKLLYKISFHTDVDRALRARLWNGIQIGRRLQRPAEPWCDLHNDPEFDQPLVSIAPGVFVCGLCRTLNTAPARTAPPTIKLVPDVERNTSPIIQERPAFAYRRQLHPDNEAGDDTQHLRSIRLKGGTKWT
jgi:hypothetical protein